MPDPHPTATPTDLGPPFDLCASETLIERGLAHVFDVVDRDEARTAFVVRFEGKVYGYLNQCAHVPTELDWQRGQVFDADGERLICAVHGALYNPQDGLCVWGPCRGGRLRALAVAEDNGRVCWYPDSRIRPAPPTPAP